MTNLDQLKSLLGKLDEPLGRYATLDRYYAGDGPLTFVSPEVRAALANRITRLSVNIPRVLVDAVAERLRITGFVGSPDDPLLWSDWLYSDMDQLSGVAHREALTLGDSFVIVWANRHGDPRVTVESARQVAVATDPGSRHITAAVKRWEAGGESHAVLYEPDRITRWTSPQLGAATHGWRKVETIPNPLGQVPVVRLRNGGRLLDEGVSEMRDVLTLTDAVCKLSLDLLTASEFGARPRRWASGIELEETPVLDETGAPTGDTVAVNPFPETDKMMVSEAAEAKFGQLPGADLAGYENAIGVLMRQISAVSGLPEHMLGIGGDNPTSADAIRASEAALTARAEARQQTFGRAWEDVARLLVAVRTGVDPASVNLRVQWADPSTRSVAQEADAVVKLHAAGILPASYALAKLGYSADEIAEIERARAAEQQSAATADVVARARLADQLTTNGLSQPAALAAAGLFAAANETRTDERN